MYIVYGIPNCDTIKKVRDWLNRNNIKYDFHNYKTDGIGATKLKAWCAQVGWETILNKKSTSWKDLGPAAQQKVTNETAAIKLMLENNSIIKRPVIEKDGKVIAVGFTTAGFEKAFL